MVGIGQIVQWVTGKSSTQNVERTPVTPTPPPNLPKVDLNKLKNPQGYPTPFCYEYWANNIREFDELGEVRERFMDWFRRIA